MPGPSFAPILAAIGAFILMLGLVFGGPMLWSAGWSSPSRCSTGGVGHAELRPRCPSRGREWPRTAAGRAADAHRGTPPPGVHIPAPSFRPLFVCVGLTILMGGLIVGGWALVVGAIAMTLVGWLVDAGQEYPQRGGRRCDRPSRAVAGAPNAVAECPMWSVLGVIFVANLLQTGLLPPSSASGGGPVASGSPSPSRVGRTVPDGTRRHRRAGAARARPWAADAKLTAQGINFIEKTGHGPGRQAVQRSCSLKRRSGGRHMDVAFKDGAGSYAWRVRPSPASRRKVYDVPALSAGSYTYVCTIHSNMTGTATLK